MADSVGSGFPSTGIQKGHIFYDLDEQSLWQYMDGVPRLASSWKLIGGNFSSDPDISSWGLIQAGAIWFNSSERTYKGWNGVEIVYVTNGAPVGLYNYRNSILLQDDFVSGNNLTGSIGLYGWVRLNGNSSGFIGGVANHPGIITIDTTAVSNTFVIFQNGLSTDTYFSMVNPYSNIWICRPNNVDTDTLIRFGVGRGNVTGTPNSGSYFEKLTTDTNWFCVTRDAAVSTRTDSGIAAVVDWVNMRIERVDSSVLFYINNVLVATNTTNLPTVFGEIFLHITNIVAASKTIDIDYIEGIFSGIVR